ncbi:hypothetical protein FQA47_013703 [Oryzias melastigma]|uniref:Uncharacterized protein n=1 Tax=Oryzias melastigma TaxID=30732 RepID=A0A834FGQ5_ORYME|nr:hypothetical protein FQA47_013703 [Oryzias melastigma]
MTSASYDTFSSAGLGRRQPEEEGGEGQKPAEVIPLTRTGGDYKTTSCLTLSRREPSIELRSADPNAPEVLRRSLLYIRPSHQPPHDFRHTLLHWAEERVWIQASTS